MAADSFTEVTSQSWFSRLGGAIKGVLIGIVLFLVAFPLLFWNEGRAVKTHKSLKQGSSEVISVATDKVDPANEGKLVHLTGLADVSDDLTDETFGISAKALRLRRDVDMYQWKETKTTDEKKKLGGGKETTTTYSYEKGWFSEHINSGSFKKPAGHENPATMAHKSTEMTAKDARLGAFQLTESLVGKIDNFRALAIADDTEVPDSLGDKASVAHGGFYIGPNPSSPAIGDLRIFFKEVPPTEISMVSAQTGDSFSPFKADAGGTIQLLQTGKVDAAAMFEKAHSDNKMLTWILRAVGVILMTIGLSMVFRPLSVAADVIPFIGSVVGAGTGFVAFSISVVLSLITISIAWVFYRPLLGIALLAVAVAVSVFLGMKLGKAKAKRRAAA